MSGGVKDPVGQSVRLVKDYSSRTENRAVRLQHECPTRAGSIRTAATAAVATAAVADLGTATKARATHGQPVRTLAQPDARKAHAARCSVTQRRLEEHETPKERPQRVCRNDFKNAAKGWCCFC